MRARLGDCNDVSSAAALSLRLGAAGDFFSDVSGMLCLGGVPGGLVGGEFGSLEFPGSRRLEAPDPRCCCCCSCEPACEAPDGEDDLSFAGAAPGELSREGPAGS